ncbi:unnamed protein product [Arabidopsis halleri]
MDLSSSLLHLFFLFFFSMDFSSLPLIQRNPKSLSLHRFLFSFFDFLFYLLNETLDLFSLSEI